MFKFFDSISNIMSTLVDTFTFFTESVVQLFTTVGKGIAFTIATIAALPPFCRGIIGIIFGVAVLSLILGNFIDIGG